MNKYQDLYKILEKGRSYELGHISTWKNGQKAVKTQDGWVLLGGPHHGKLHGKTNGPVTHKELADNELQGLDQPEKGKEETIEEKHARELKELQERHVAEKKAHEEKKQKEATPEKDKEKKVEPKESLKTSDKKTERYWDEDKQQWRYRELASTKKPEEKQAIEEKKDANKPSQSTKKEEKAPEGTPRAEAEQNTKDNQDDYENARDSKFGNKGEDLKGSARHKAMEWKGLAAAEKDGTADKLITRDKLLKLEPLNVTVQRSTALSDMILHIAMQKFPPKPSSPLLKAADGKKDDEVAVIEMDGRFYTQRYYDSIKDKPLNAGKEVKKMTAGEIRKDAREAYFDSYKQVKEKLESVGATIQDADPGAIFKAVRKAVSDVIDERRKAKRGDLGAEMLVSYHNKTLNPYSRSKNSAVAAAHEVTVSAKEADGNMHDNLFEMASQIAEGQKISKVTGQVKTKKKQFTAADRYVNIAEREGPETGLNSKDSQENYILEKAGIRGLQWGNSVTDDERKHHLKQVADAFKDLTNILDLPEEMGSFNGRLGLAIGARGKGRALAHYESSTNVINLTRKGGVGSLAHEWGHFFDKTLAETHNVGRFLSEKGSGKFSSSARQSEVREAMADLTGSDAWNKFQQQVVTEGRALGIPSEKVRKYWGSTIEMFARAFEVHIDYKLAQAGRKNTYLAGVTKGGMWPNDELAAKLEPYFDKIFETFKNSEHLKKALDLIHVLKKARSDKGKKHRHHPHPKHSMRIGKKDAHQMTDAENYSAAGEYAELATAHQNPNIKDELHAMANYHVSWVSPKYRHVVKSMKPLEPTFYVGLVVMSKDRKKFLIGKRKEDGLWTGPGGGAGLDESPKEAAIREAFEEANLKIKPYQLKELPTLTCKNNKMCHTFLVFVDKKEQNIHVGNDPDFEVKEWIWHPIDKPLPGKTDENRLVTMNNAKMKVMKLKKAEKELVQVLSGGLADKKQPKDFDQKALERGIKVEMEHTSNRKVATEIAMDHLTEDPKYYEKLATIEKAIHENPVAGIDINTSEQSLDEMASRNSGWIHIIDQAVDGSEFGENPRTIPLPEMNVLYLSKVDDGIFSGFIKKEDENAGNNGEVLTQISKMTIESIVQTLKTKGYLPKDDPNMEPMDEPKGKYAELADILRDAGGRDIHIHLHKE